MVSHVYQKKKKKWPPTRNRLARAGGRDKRTHGGNRGIRVGQGGPRTAVVGRKVKGEKGRRGMSE